MKKKWHIFSRHVIERGHLADGGDGAVHFSGRRLNLLRGVGAEKKFFARQLIFDNRIGALLKQGSVVGYKSQGERVERGDVLDGTRHIGRVAAPLLFIDKLTVRRQGIVDGIVKVFVERCDVVVPVIVKMINVACDFFKGC